MRANWIHSPRGTYILRMHRNNINHRAFVVHGGTRRDGNPISRARRRWLELG